MDREVRQRDRGPVLILSSLVGRIVRDDIDLLLNCSRFVVRRQGIEVEAEYGSFPGRLAYRFHGHKARDPETCKLSDALSPKHGSAPGRLFLGRVSSAVAAHREVEALTPVEVHADPVVADHERGSRIGGGVW